MGVQAQAVTSSGRSGRITRPIVSMDSSGDDPMIARRGRGAVTNPPNRFEDTSTSAFDDGWGTLPSALLDLPALQTEFIRDATRSVISYNSSPDLGFDRSVNVYRGCEHGCVYCYARPTHAYLGYSPGLDFETKLLYKPEAAQMLERELRRQKYIAKPIVLGANTDPYQPIDRTLKLTRSVLEVLDRFNHPAIVVTKSASVLRDLDILQSMARRNLLQVYISVTTLDPALARRMEPRAAAPGRRIAAIGELSRAGVPVAVLAAPMIPGLNDSELEGILRAAATAGATHAGYGLLRLPLELAQMFEDWLGLHYPDRARRVLHLIRETRAGALNDSAFGQRFSGVGAYAEMLRLRFDKTARQLGLAPRGELDSAGFAVPWQTESACGASQMTLL